jgi:DNA-binding transcriptional regulator YiaG
MRMKPKQCGNCGKREMELQSLNGPFPWKDYSCMFLLQPLELLKCKNCGEIGYRPKDAERIDRVIEATIRTLVGGFIHTILEREKCSQIVLAERIGVTEAYLSFLKTGSRTSGFQTFNILKILAEDPSAFKISDPVFELEKMISSSDPESYETVLKKLA